MMVRVSVTMSPGLNVEGLATRVTVDWAAFPWQPPQSEVTIPPARAAATRSKRSTTAAAMKKAKPAERGGALHTRLMIHRGLWRRLGRSGTKRDAERRRAELVDSRACSDRSGPQGAPG